jgi:hypothetical protein
MEDTCIGCNENAVSITELYCLDCYLDHYAESLAVAEEINQLFTVKEAN